jgi:hypothetical protein
VAVDGARATQARNCGRLFYRESHGADIEDPQACQIRLIMT